MVMRLHDIASRAVILTTDLGPADALKRLADAKAAIVLSSARPRLKGILTPVRASDAVAAGAPHIKDYIERDVLVLDGAQTAEHLARTWSPAQHGILPAWLVTRGPAGDWRLLDAARLAGFLADHVRRLSAAHDDAVLALAHMRQHNTMFLAHLGHELKTPLNAVLGYADLMLSPGAARPLIQDQRRYALALRDGGQHLLGIVENMMNMAKLRASVLELHETALSLPDLAQSALELLGAVARARGLRLDLKLKGPLPPVLGDRQLLKQIMLNLLSNAIKFSPPGETVLLRIERRARGEVRLSVEDHGPGIPANQIERVMQPFQCLDNQPANTDRGSGLGLPLVRAFTELHEGRFQLLSTEGRGTRAIVTLPPGRVLDHSPGRQQAFAFQRRTSA